MCAGAFFLKINTMTLQEAVQKHSTAVNHLHKRFKIRGNSPEHIRQAHETYGTAYTTRLIDILRDENISNWDQIGPPTESQYFAQQQPGRFWNFLDNLLGAGVNTSAAYAQIKANVTGQPTMYDYSAMQAQRQNNLLWIAAFVAIIIVLIIIFKK